MDKDKKNMFKSIAFLTVISLIIISFIFSGYFDSSVSNHVATVNGNPIKASTFNQQLNNLIYRQKMMNRSESLSSEQIKKLRLKERVLDSLINNKVFENMASEMNLHPSKQEIAEYIMNIPFFKTNEVFDKSKYLNYLKNSRQKADLFEKEIAKGISIEKLGKIITKLPVSRRFAEKSANIKRDQSKLSALFIDKNNMKKFIDVKNVEISNYLVSKESDKELKSLFQRKKASLDKPKQFKISQILLTNFSTQKENIDDRMKKIKKSVNKRNFVSVAKKKSEDKFTNLKNGILTWVNLGTLPPAVNIQLSKAKKGTIIGPIKSYLGQHLIFVKEIKKAIPAKFSKYRYALAKEILQNQRPKKLNILVNKVSNDILKAYNDKNRSKIKKIQKKYDLKLNEQSNLTLLNRLVFGEKIDIKVLSELLESSKKGKNLVKKLEIRDKIIFISTLKSTKSKKKSLTKNASENTLSLENELKSLQSDFSAMFNKEITQALRESSNIITNPRFF